MMPRYIEYIRLQRRRTCTPERTPVSVTTTSLSPMNEDAFAVLILSNRKEKESTFCIKTKQNHDADENFCKEDTKKSLVTNAAAVEIPADINNTTIAGNFIYGWICVT